MIDDLKGSIVNFKLNFEKALENKCESVWWWQISSKILVCLKSQASPLFTQSFIRAQIKENIKADVTGLCAGNSPNTGELPALMASNAESVSIWWRHRGFTSRIVRCNSNDVKPVAFENACA